MDEGVEVGVPAVAAERGDGLKAARPAVRPVARVASCPVANAAAALGWPAQHRVTVAEVAPPL